MTTTTGAARYRFFRITRFGRAWQMRGRSSEYETGVRRIYNSEGHGLLPANDSRVTSAKVDQRQRQGRDCAEGHYRSWKAGRGNDARIKMNINHKNAVFSKPDE